jgi:hypothetical protein
MRKNAKVVLDAFSSGKVANKKTIRTNGTELFSYNMMIARKNGNKVEIIESSASPSKTTTIQINACVSYFPANQVVRVSSF